MSTEGLKGIDALRKAIQETADDVRAQAQATAREADRIEREKREIEEQQRADAEAAAIAARRLEQEHLDNLDRKDEELKELDHRAEQQAYVLTGNRSDEPPAQPEPPAPQLPTAPSPRDGETQELPPMAPPPPGYGVEDDHLVPNMRYPEETPAPRRHRNNGNPRHWHGLAWLLALAGAFIGLIVARVTYGPMWSNVSGAWNTLLVVLWFVALIAAGFFTGGWFGATREERRQGNPGPRQA